MSYKRVEFEPRHIDSIDLQVSQIGDTINLKGLDWSKVLEAGPCWSGFAGSKLLWCYGLVPQWPGRALAWAMISRDVGPAGMLAIHRDGVGTLVEFQRDAAYKRIETSVLAEFNEGHRWAEMLGFKAEGIMRCYDALGRDHWLYARVR